MPCPGWRAAEQPGLGWAVHEGRALQGCLERLRERRAPAIPCLHTLPLQLLTSNNKLACNPQSKRVAKKVSNRTVIGLDQHHF